MSEEVFHHAVAQTFQLDHPVEDFARRGQNPVLYLEERSRVLSALLGSLKSDDRTLKFHRNCEASGVVDRLNDAASARQSGQALLQSRTGCVTGDSWPMRPPSWCLS